MPIRSYASPLQSMLNHQGGAVVQTPQQLPLRAGLPPVGGSRVQASLQVYSLCRGRNRDRTCKQPMTSLEIKEIDRRSRLLLSAQLLRSEDMLDEVCQSLMCAS